MAPWSSSAASAGSSSRNRSSCGILPAPSRAAHPAMRRRRDTGFLASRVLRTRIRRTVAACRAPAVLLPLEAACTQEAAAFFFAPFCAASSSADAAWHPPTGVPTSHGVCPQNKKNGACPQDRCEKSEQNRAYPNDLGKMRIICGKSWDGSGGMARRRGGGGLATLKASQARPRTKTRTIRRDFTERARRLTSHNAENAARAFAQPALRHIAAREASRRQNNGSRERAGQ